MSKIILGNLCKITQKEIVSPCLPFSIISESIELPGIEFRNIVLGAHDNTKSEYTTEKVKIFGGTTPQAGPSIDVEGYSVGYEITGGQVLSITPDIEGNSLIIEISTTGDGELIITLPRAVIDAVLESGDDGKFFVLVDAEESDLDETKTADSRTLTIAFPDGTEEIEIIGTFVIPEFGTIAMMILGITIVSILAITTRYKMITRF